MPEDNDPITSTDTAPQEASAPHASQSDEARHAIIRDLTAERKARKAAETRLAELIAADETRTRELAEEQGKFKELYSTVSTQLEQITAERDQYAARETARLEALTSRNAEALKAFPESYRPLIPEGMSPDEVAAQIERVKGIVGAQPTHPTGTQAHGGRPAGISDEAKAWAEKYRTSPEVAQQELDARKARKDKAER